MDWCRYRFRSVWPLDPAPERVYAVLERAEEYPRWWPQVREVSRVDDRVGVVRMRSALPYELCVTAREARRDPAARILEITMTGDLDGWARWRLIPGPRGTGTQAVFEQDVIVRKRLMRVLAVPARPLFRANHAAMMRGGRRGLTELLAAGDGAADHRDAV
ncbi:SRPBCC family protein [Streptomyces sp. RB6PN25]|uniref:SRPBCC family protein n=1 Tax=Streptomyces humicola TaxID=2953240 RepID=A0ABT1PYJ1_9ACTN|nr:SRPBCC family protein [Streptomyces humicola]MCQ4082740.1 SRPBCC family protein [Streptomyces humicola]